MPHPCACHCTHTMMQMLIEIAAHIAALMIRFVFIAVLCFAVVSKNTALARVLSLASASTFDAFMQARCRSPWRELSVPWLAVTIIVVFCCVILSYAVCLFASPIRFDWFFMFRAIQPVFHVVYAMFASFANNLFGV